MCKKLLSWLINNPKLSWLKKEKPNPYAFVIDKLDIYIGLTALIPFLLVFFFGKQMTCPSILLAIPCFTGLVIGIRGVISRPADLEIPFSKPSFCAIMIIFFIVAMNIAINGLQCLINSL